MRWKREEVIKSSEKETLWIERRPTWQLANEHDGDEDGNDAHDDDADNYLDDYDEIQGHYQ